MYGVSRGLVIAVIAASSVPAQAQTFGNFAPPMNGYNMQRGLGADRPFLRVQVNYQIQIAQDRAAALDDQKTTIEAAHAALYDLAKRECELLVKAFEGDCQLSGITINNQQGFNGGGAVPFNASATFEMVPRPATPAAKTQ